LTLALLANPTQAQPPTANENRGATVEEYPVDFFIDSTPCPDCGGCGIFGEYIRVEGTLRIVSHFFTDEDGGFHSNSRSILVNTTGAGYTREDDGTYTPSGTKYVIVSSGGDVASYIAPDGQFNSGTMVLNVFVQKGGGTPGDETITKQVGFYTAHVIYYPDGTIKVENAAFHRQCV
jgi:hypothetical protein